MVRVHALQRILIVPFLAAVTWVASGCGGPGAAVTPAAEDHAVNQSSARAQNKAQIKAAKKANTAKPGGAPSEAH